MQGYSNEYSTLGFDVASVELPTDSESTSPILTTNQIIGIAVGGGLGLILILAILLIIITW